MSVTVIRSTKGLDAEQSVDTALPFENDFVCLLETSPMFFKLSPCSTSLYSTSSCRHWIFDSGCTLHVTYDQSAFISYTPAGVVSNLDLRANSSAPIVGRSDVRIDLCMPDGSVKPCLVRNVLHVPDFQYQPFSLSEMSKLGANVRFDESSAQLVRNSDACVVGTGTFRNALYIYIYIYINIYAL